MYYNSSQMWQIATFSVIGMTRGIKKVPTKHSSEKDKQPPPLGRGIPSVCPEEKSLKTRKVMLSDSFYIPTHYSFVMGCFFMT